MSRAIAAGIRRLTDSCILNGYIWKCGGCHFGFMQNPDEWKLTGWVGRWGFSSLFALAGTDDG